jgi:hypothetical protein
MRPFHVSSSFLYHFGLLVLVVTVANLGTHPLSAIKYVFRCLLLPHLGNLLPHSAGMFGQQCKVFLTQYLLTHQAVARRNRRRAGFGKRPDGFNGDPAYRIITLESFFSI